MLPGPVSESPHPNPFDFSKYCPESVSVRERLVAESIPTINSEVSADFRALPTTKTCPVGRYFITRVGVWELSLATGRQEILLYEFCRRLWPWSRAIRKSAPSWLEQGVA